METQQNKYKNGEIHRVSDISYTNFHSGSTVQPLSVRMGGHRKTYRRYKNNTSAHDVSIYDVFDEFGLEIVRLSLLNHILACPMKVCASAKDTTYK